jgi:hypothetical protein
MQATRTYRRIGISKQLLVAVTALLAGLLIAGAYLMSRTTQTIAPATAHVVASQPPTSQAGGVAPSKYREPASGRSGPQLAP